jgi:hypothetical protein
MAVNSNPSLLDTHQITKRTFDSDNDAVRVVLGDATGLAMELSATDGDTIMAIGTTDGTTSGTQKAIKLGSDGTVQVAGAVTVSGTATVTPASSTTKASLTTSSTGVVVAAESCVGMHTFNLFTKTTATITGAQAITVEFSPHDSDDVWKATALTITPDTTADVVVMGTPLTGVCARRVRVSIAAAISAGTFDVYLVKHGT